MGIRHDRVSLVPNDPSQPDLVQPDDWNADHVIDDVETFRDDIDVYSRGEVTDYINDLATTTYQPLNDVLTALSALAMAADRLGYFDGSGSAALAVFTAVARTLLAAATQADQRTALGLGSAALAALDTDVSLAANANDRTPSQAAIKAYIASVVTGGAAGVMLFKNVIDCSANPNYPAADAGNVYKISVAGKIGGASGPNVEVGDTLYCITNSTASGTQAAVGANWVIVQENIDGAVVGPSAATDLHIAIYDGVTGKIIKDGGKLLTDFILNTLTTTLGDIIYASAANTPTRLAGNTDATRKFLRQTGTGSASAAPAWDTIVENDIGASTNNAGNTSTAITIDWSLARTQKITATGNATVTHSNMVAGVVYTLEYRTGAGSFTGTFASTNWAGGTAPVLTATASKLDVFTFYKTVDNTIIGAVFGQSFTP